MRKKQICSCLNLNSWLIQILSLGVTKGCWSLLTSQTGFSILMDMPSCHVHANADSQGLVAILCCDRDCEDVLSSQRFITTPDIFITWALTFAGSFQLFGLSSPTAGTLGCAGACCFAYADGLDLWTTLLGLVTSHQFLLLWNGWGRTNVNCSTKSKICSVRKTSLPLWLIDLNFGLNFAITGIPEWLHGMVENSSCSCTTWFSFSLSPISSWPWGCRGFVFAVFKLNSEPYETWHLRQNQKGKLLLQKYEKGMQGIFQDLKPPKRDRLDLLHQKHTFSVLAVDVDSGQLHLDAPISRMGISKWTAGDAMLQPKIINKVVIQVRDVSLFEQGDLVEQHCPVSETASLHAELLNYWPPTWKAMSTVDNHTWCWVTAFFQAYVPRFHMELGPIQPDQWFSALKRYKPNAARGVDVVSHRDLLSLPLAWTLKDCLTYFMPLNLVRQAGPPPPFCMGLSTFVNVDRFRKVVIFSVIYRTWAQAGAKQLLRWLTPMMDVEAFGFMPGCEPSQRWWVLQAEIERALQAQVDLCCLGTDITRAFNFIPRQHSFALAEHLGVPARIVVPCGLFGSLR